MAWWVYAAIAALVWGLHYNLIAKTLTVASPVSVLALQIIPVIVIVPLWYGTISADFKQILMSTWDVKVSTVTMIFTSVIATIALYKAIDSSNATLASLIEISYPVFVALFAIVIFKENHLDWATVVGGMLVLSGTALIIYNHG